MSVLAETAFLADTAAFRRSAPRYLNTVDGADVEDWGAMLVVFDDGTVAQIAAADTVLGGIRNHLEVYAAKAVVLCNINPNDAVQAYAPDPSSSRPSTSPRRSRPSRAGRSRSRTRTG